MQGQISRAPDEPEADGCDVAWLDIAPAPVAAAKLHVLHLEPIEARLGARWTRLSALVHKLFEKALKRSQGPRDHFIAVDDMSYVVTFHGLTTEEAALACAAIAKEVCDHLFGDGIDDVAVRSLVACVPASAVQPPLDGRGLAALLERTGAESFAHPVPPCTVPAPATGAARELLHAMDRSLGIFPVWDLHSRKSSAVLLCARGAGGGAVPMRRLMAGLNDHHIVDGEIALLAAAGDYARRVRAERRICAVGVGVSYESLSGFHSRIRYIGGLKAAPIPPRFPFLLKIEQVPEGTPLARLAEIIAMLQRPGQRILVEFSLSLPALDLRLGAHGIGVALPEYCSPEAADAIVQKLSGRARQQKAFGFVGGLATAALVEAVRRHPVRLGMGRGFGDVCLEADRVADFPLTAC